MNETNISFTSKSHYIGELYSDVEWRLADDNLVRFTKKNKTTTYLLSSINSIRLCYHMGGKGSSAKYCCYLQIEDEWDTKYDFSSADFLTNTADYQQYYLFVTSLLQKVKQANPSVKLISGHGTGTFSLYIGTSILLLLLPYIVHQYHIITQEETMWATVVLFVLCLPMIGSTIKYLPKEIAIDQIPKNVLPKPKI